MVKSGHGGFLRHALTDCSDAVGRAFAVPAHLCDGCHCLAVGLHQPLGDACSTWRWGTTHTHTHTHRTQHSASSTLMYNMLNAQHTATHITRALDGMCGGAHITHTPLGSCVMRASGGSSPVHRPTACLPAAQQLKKEAHA